MTKIVDAIPDTKIGKVKWLTPEEKTKAMEETEQTPIGIPKIVIKKLLALGAKDGFKAEATTERGKKILATRVARTYLLLAVEMLLEKREGER